MTIASTCFFTIEPELSILMRRQQSGKASIYNLKAAAQCVNFLTANGIKDVAGLDGKLQAMIDKQFVIRDKLKSTERRLKTLDEHIRHGGNFKAHRGHKAQYEKLYAQYRAIKKAGGFGAERKAQKALDTANTYHVKMTPPKLRKSAGMFMTL